MISRSSHNCTLLVASLQLAPKLVPQDSPSDQGNLVLGQPFHNFTIVGPITTPQRGYARNLSAPQHRNRNRQRFLNRRQKCKESPR